MNLLNKKGATELADRIQLYWSELGWDVKAIVFCTGERISQSSTLVYSVTIIGLDDSGNPMNRLTKIA